MAAVGAGAMSTPWMPRPWPRRSRRSTWRRSTRRCNRLARLDPQKAKLVELRYFAGLTGDQAAAVLGMSPSSADRQWVYARAWLRRELGCGAEGSWRRTIAGARRRNFPDRSGRAAAF